MGSFHCDKRKKTNGSKYAIDDKGAVCELIQQATKSWLTAAQIDFLMQQNLPLTKLQKTAQSGSLFLLSKNDFDSYRAFKSDGYHWKKKRGSNAVRKDVMKLMIDKIPTIEAHYYHSEKIPTFKRRAYMRLIGDARTRKLVLVHYLDPGTVVEHRSGCTCLRCSFFREYEPKLNQEYLISSDDFSEITAILKENDDSDQNDWETLNGRALSKSTVDIAKIRIKEIAPKNLICHETTKVLMCLCYEDQSPIDSNIANSKVKVKLGEDILLPGSWVIPGVIATICPEYSGGDVVLPISLLFNETCFVPPLLKKQNSQDRAMLTYIVPPVVYKSRGNLEPITLLKTLESKRKRINCSEEKLISGSSNQTLDNIGEEELSEMTEIILEKSVNLLIELSREEKGMQAMFHNTISKETAIGLSNELNALDENGYSMLHYTALYNNERLVLVLLDHGAEVNCRTSSGDTALHFAVASKNCRISKMLLENGANPLLKDAFGMNAYDIALLHHEREIINILEPHMPKDCYSIRESVSSAAEKMQPISVDSNDVQRIRDNIHENHLRAALASLSLRERCALSLVSKHPCSSSTGGTSRSNIQRIVSEEEQELHAAISAMDEDERKELEEEARIIQINFRKWLLRKNLERSFKEQRETKDYLFQSSKLEENATKVQAASKGFLARKDYRQARQEVIQLQAATRGILARREFQKLRKQVNSILVIQRFFRARRKRKRQLG